jgi:CheY-like chemotaxis protein
MTDTSTVAAATRILMVDDEPDAQDLFRQNFRREIRKGIYTFDFAISGEAALDLLKGQEPPKVVLVLSDINMPGMSGIELLAAIREFWPDVGVFMITAYGDSATEARARELGADNFLTKPVDFALLKQDLARTVEATR